MMATSVRGSCSVLTRSRRVSVAAAAAAALLIGAAASEARVTSITINATTPAFDGRMFGNVGAYEQLRGTASGELDPGDRRNAVITDIDLAPRNVRGKVEYTATFTLLKPVDMSRASGILVYEVNNRGNKILLLPPGLFNVGVTPTNPAGDGFLFKTGNVYLWSGWQGDLVFNPALPAETISLPIVSGVTGRVFARFVTVPGNVNTQTLPGRGRTPATLDTTKAKLISIARENNLGVRSGVVEIPSSEWAFANCSSTPFPGMPSSTQICLKNGFNPNLVYELVYTAKDPLVLGVGMAAMRDVVSFFRRASADQGNPIGGRIGSTTGVGLSQSGRYMKNFILLGFNEDEEGRMVWEGAHVIVGGAMGQFNIRFAQPGNIANIFEPGAEGPLWWGDYDDRARGRGVTGILDRCRRTDTCPKIFDDLGGPEIWYGRGGVGIAGTGGTEGHKDVPLPHDVRRYYHPSTSHGGGTGGFAVAQPSQAGLMLASNPNPEVETRRALFLHMIDWVSKGTLPPRSRYPRASDGTLVAATAAAMGWPDIPGAPTPDNVVNALMDYDYGPDFRYSDESGVMTNVVPPIKQIIPTPVPKVDEDGNEIAGARSVLLQAPLGTYTSWNPVARGPLRGNEGNLASGYIPFALSRAARLASGDPRPSIEERYGSQEGYDCVVRNAARRNVKARLLLQEDADRLIAQAAASNVLPSDARNPVAKRLCAKSADDEDADGRGQHDD
jgi:hypothetical protein